MLSRVADNICWMSRYMERSKMQLSLLRTHYIASQDGVDVQWKSILQLYGMKIPETNQTAREIVNTILLNKEHPASILNSIIQARENGRAVQDHITKEVWQCLNDNYHKIREPQLEKQIFDEDPITVFDILQKQCNLFYGTVDITMSRGEGFYYLNIGKFLERAYECVRIMQMQWQIEQENPEQSNESWRYILFSLSGYEFYLKTYRDTVLPANVMEQAMYENLFPHSVLYCLNQVYRYLERMKPYSLEDSYERLDYLIGKSINDIKYSSVHHLPVTDQLQFLALIRQDIFNIGQAFNKFYFGISS